MGKSTDSFPVKLHLMLEWMHNDLIHASTRSLPIQWLPHGKAFVINDHDAFATSVLPHFFRRTKFKSFQRKLNRWGFTLLRQGPDKGAYYHSSFNRWDTPHDIPCMPPKEKKNSSITESEGQFKSEATDEPPLSNSESLDSLSSRRVSENTLDEVTSMASGNWGDQNGFATIRRVSDDTQNDEWSGFEENTLNQPNITTLGAVGQWSNMGDMGVPIPRDDIQAISSDFQLPVIDTGVLNKYQSAAFPQTYAPARKKSPQNIPSAHSITLGEVGQWSNMLGDIPIPPISEGAQHNFQLASFPPINASTRRKSLHTVLPSQNVDPSPYAAMHALTRRNSLHTVLPSQTGSEETFNEQKIQVDVNKFYDAGMHNPVQEGADENEPTCARIIKEEAQMDEDLKKFLERFEAPMYEGGDESDTSISFNA